MKIIDGKKISADLIDSYKKVAEKNDIKLAIILIGDNEASKIYVNMKRKACEKSGIAFELIKFESDVAEEEVIRKIIELNANSSVTGILVQLPLPKHLKTRKILDIVLETKDVDGLSSGNLGKLFAGEKAIIPATPKGAMKLLEIENIPLEGKEILVIGRSNLVGKPLGLLCVNKRATVTFANSKTRDLKMHCLNSDIILSATGVPKMVKKDMIKEGTVIIDIGISRVDGKIVGDVDFENVKDKCSLITPVPGGAGPMTIAMLIDNLIELSENFLK